MWFKFQDSCIRIPLLKLKIIVGPWRKRNPVFPVGVLLATQCLADHHQHDHHKTSHKSPDHKSIVPPKGERVPSGKKPPVPPQDHREKPPQDQDHNFPKKGSSPGKNDLPLKKLPPPGKKSPVPPHKPPTTF